LSKANLAKMVNLNAATCRRKTLCLLDEGFISGFRAMVNPNAVNHGTLVMVGVVLNRSTHQSFSGI